MYELIIIGAGPAGLTAGLYAGRFRLNALVLERMGIGGQIITAPAIENFPGFPGGISTEEFIERIKKQVDDVGINIEIREALEIAVHPEFKMPVYKVKTSDRIYETKSIIIATGAQAKKLVVKGEDKLIGRGLSYCATCDGPLFKDKEVVVVGGGDRAIAEAIFLATYAKKVTVIHRRNEFRASQILEDKARENPKINFLLDSVVEEIIGLNKVEAVKIKQVKTGLIADFGCQGVFIFVGISPNTEFLKNLLQLNNLGFIITDQMMKTTARGIFACGDCIEKSLYQLVNACAEAAVAADSVHKYLLTLEQ